MGEAIYVDSILVLEDFRASLTEFAKDAQDALSAAEMEIRRTSDWLQQQLRLWQSKVRVYQDEVSQAKNDLARRKLFKEFGRTPDCTIQEEALREAKARLKHAEEKVHNCKHWLHVLPREVLEYEGQARQLMGVLSADVPRALALLERKIDDLEAYLAVAPPSMTAPAPAGTTSSSTPGTPSALAPTPAAILEKVAEPGPTTAAVEGLAPAPLQEEPPLDSPSLAR